MKGPTPPHQKSTNMKDHVSQGGTITNYTCKYPEINSIYKARLDLHNSESNLPKYLLLFSIWLISSIFFIKF